MQIFVQGGTGGTSSYIINFTTPYAAALFLCVHQYSPHLPTVSSSHSLTAILVSRFLINLQEANLRSVKVDSEDPAYISSHSENSLPSFVAAPGTARAPNESKPQNMRDELLGTGEADGADRGEDNTPSIETLPLEVVV